MRDLNKFHFKCAVLIFYHLLTNYVFVWLFHLIGFSPIQMANLDLIISSTGSITNTLMELSCSSVFLQHSPFFPITLSLLYTPLSLSHSPFFTHLSPLPHHRLPSPPPRFRSTAPGPPAGTPGSVLRWQTLSDLHVLNQVHFKSSSLAKPFTILQQRFKYMSMDSLLKTFREAFSKTTDRSLLFVWAASCF